MLAHAEDGGIVRLEVKRPGAVAGLLIAVVVLVGAAAALIGWAVGRQTAPGRTTMAVGLVASVPAGHMGGPNLPIAQIGDPARGARLWQEKRCSDCHSYGGRGGKDAPPLDFMRGHMSAREIADMSGKIWDHMPAMLLHFREEKIPVPAFAQGEMADLIAFLHSGTGAKAGMPPTHPATTGMSGMGGAMGAAGGKALFLSAGCGACHTFGGAGTRASMGPNLDVSLMGKTAAFLRESILHPNASVAKGFRANVMPMTYGSQLTSSQIDALIAFLLKNRK
jgi:mono/diheme cytochrome c family protein